MHDLTATNPRSDQAPFGRTEGGGPEVASFTLDNGLDVADVWADEVEGEEGRLGVEGEEEAWEEEEACGRRRRLVEEESVGLAGSSGDSDLCSFDWLGGGRMY